MGRTGRPIVHVGEVVVGCGDVGNGFVSKLVNGVLRVVVLNHVRKMHIVSKLCCLL